MNPKDASLRGKQKYLPALLLFAVALAWLEAMVVVYIREMFGISDVIELDLTMFGRIAGNPEFLRREQTREVATMALLIAGAWLYGTDLRTRAGALLIVWGAWDIFYYLSLYAIMRWPPSLFTSDILFLIPPSPLWVQPVILPVIASMGMITIGVVLLRPVENGKTNH